VHQSGRSKFWTLFTAGLGELQSSLDLRIEAHSKGYRKGLPDLLIFEKTEEYSGFAIELKHPGFEAEARSEQLEVLSDFRQRGWKILVSSDFTEVLLELSEYLRMYLHRCNCCKQNNEKCVRIPCVVRSILAG
jgi:hypothetical protein